MPPGAMSAYFPPPGATAHRLVDMGLAAVEAGSVRTRAGPATEPGHRGDDPPAQRKETAMYHHTVLLAAALQRWDRHSMHALAARDVAAAFVSSTSRRLHVLSAYDCEYIPRTLPAGMAATLRQEEYERTEAIMTQKIDEYVAPLVAEGLEVLKILRVGHPREVILDVAREVQADLLVMGTHSKRRIFEVALGGTARHVSQHAPCTVVLVSPQK
jgi:nucleotide-binding universal stress UspA family protein